MLAELFEVSLTNKGLQPPKETFYRVRRDYNLTAKNYLGAREFLTMVVDGSMHISSCSKKVICIERIGEDQRPVKHMFTNLSSEHLF